jgi:GntR family phosphonate transport system transcriptional regulator
MPAQRPPHQSADEPSSETASASAGTRWSRIASDIAGAIEKGQHADGSTLPSAAALAERYGVNRHTARQALRHLQDLGLVTVERGRGSIVRGHRFPYRLGRRVSFRANFGAAGIDAGGEVLESGLTEADADVAQLLRLEIGARIWEIRTLSRAAGVAVSTSVHRLGAASFPKFDERILAARASVTAAFTSYGIADYVRLSTRLTARAATRIESRVLGIGRDAPVMQSFAVDGLEDGTPLQVVVGAFAGDKVEMVLDRSS